MDYAEGGLIYRLDHSHTVIKAGVSPSTLTTAEIFALGVDSTRSIVGSTILPMLIFRAENRGVTELGTPANGEAYTFVERSRGEVWMGTYADAGTTRLRKLEGDTLTAFPCSGVRPIWRPKAITTDRTHVWMGGNNGDDHGETAEILGVFVRVDAQGATQTSFDVINQIPLCMDHQDGLLYVCGGGEGIAGADVTPKLYAIDPTTMTPLWSANLAGTRPLSMARVGTDRYLVICHLISTTQIRLVLVDTTTQTRVWHRTLPPLVFGRARNALRWWAGKLWAQCDDGLHEIDVGRASMRLRFPIDTGEKPAGLVEFDGALFTAYGAEIYRMTVGQP